METRLLVNSTKIICLTLALSKPKRLGTLATSLSGAKLHEKEGYLSATRTCRLSHPITVE